MRAAMPEAGRSARPRLLFVDDEQRVLNSMRIMFRRTYDLYLASHGREALEIVGREDIDVIVADHRMPQMTGVEVLSRVRAMSPRTVRILLTGYADLDAVEGSINESEVFRFLTKPCAPQQLKETVELAARLAREAPALAQPAPEPRVAAPAATAPVAAGSAAAARPEPPQPRAAGLAVVVLSADEHVVETVQAAAHGRVPVYRAFSVAEVVEILNAHRPGVLVTDVSADRAAMQALTARLKAHLPQLVTIAVSEHRDVLDMVWLINHGQIFRFLRKPLSPGRCAVSLQAALKYHRTLLGNPELARRHAVETAGEGGLLDGVLSGLRGLKRLWAASA